MWGLLANPFGFDGNNDMEINMIGLSKCFFALSRACARRDVSTLTQCYTRRVRTGSYSEDARRSLRADAGEALSF
jgi:hypothetical protein